MFSKRATVFCHIRATPLPLAGGIYRPTLGSTSWVPYSGKAHPLRLYPALYRGKILPENCKR